MLPTRKLGYKFKSETVNEIFAAINLTVLIHLYRVACQHGKQSGSKNMFSTMKKYIFPFGGHQQTA